jgi:hypothetical protein
VRKASCTAARSAARRCGAQLAGPALRPSAAKLGRQHLTKGCSATILQIRPTRRCSTRLGDRSGLDPLGHSRLRPDKRAHTAATGASNVNSPRASTHLGRGTPQPRCRGSCGDAEQARDAVIDQAELFVVCMPLLHWLPVGRFVAFRKTYFMSSYDVIGSVGGGSCAGPGCSGCCCCEPAAKAAAGSLAAPAAAAASRPPRQQQAGRLLRLLLLRAGCYGTSGAPGCSCCCRDQEARALAGQGRMLSGCWSIPGEMA